MPSRAVVIAGSVVVASLALGLSFWLGAWAFDTRQWVYHDTRLRRMVQQHPSIDRATRASPAASCPTAASRRLQGRSA